MTGILSRVRRLASLAGWTLADQVLSALSNVLLSVLVARSVDAAGFGAFSAAFLVFSLMLGLTRAGVGQPLQIGFSAAAPRQFRSALRSALGAALWWGVAAGAISCVIGVVVAGPTGQALVALGLCLPGLLLQDTCRMAFFAAARPQSAALIDALWAAALFPALLIVQSVGVTQIWVPVALWGATATVAAGVGLARLSTVPRLRRSLAWAWGQRRQSGYLTAEFVMNQGVAQVGILAVAVLGSEAGVGALRAAQVLLGPLNIVGAAAFMFAVPEVARRTELSARQRGVLATGVSGAVGLAAAVYCSLILLLPDTTGRALFGDTWSGATEVLLPVCLMSIAASIATGPAATLYGIGLARITFRLNVLKAPLLVLTLGIAIPLYGAVGAAWALAITEILMLPLWFLRLRSALHRTSAHEPAPDGPPASSPESVVPRGDGPSSPSRLGTAEVGVLRTPFVGPGAQDDPEHRQNPADRKQDR